MNQRKNKGFLAALPLFLFTVVFVVGPLIYMVALSFATNNEGYGVTWKLTFENYLRILDPVYLQTFGQSFQLAITSTLVIMIIGYPFGYFMAKLTRKWRKRTMLLIMLPFWVNSLIRLYGWIIILQTKGALNGVLMGLGIIEEPLKLLYSYPAIVIGMVYALLPFMILSVYSSAEKLDWSLIEASRDLGATPFSDLSHHYSEADPSRSSFRSHPQLYSFHGSVFIADILGGNKIVLVGSLIQDQMTRGSNWPFAAALAVILTILTTIMIVLYRRITKVKDLEGLY